MYCPDEAEDRSATDSSDVMPSFKEAKAVVVKTEPPAVVEMRTS